MKSHRMKCWPEPFAAILLGEKTAEVRRDDRGFAVDDELLLCEWDQLLERHTGREIVVVVRHIVPGGTFGLPSGLCVMSIAKRGPRS